MPSTPVSVATQCAAPHALNNALRLDNLQSCDEAIHELRVQVANIGHHQLCVGVTAPSTPANALSTDRSRYSNVSSSFTRSWEARLNRRIALQR